MAPIGHRISRARAGRLVKLAWAIGALTLAGLLPVAAQAQQPTLQSELVSLLGQLRNGQCASEMTPILHAQCLQQIGNFRARLGGLGNISQVTFKGFQYENGSTSELYDIRFANGDMLWRIASDGHGQISMLWTPG